MSIVVPIPIVVPAKAGIHNPGHLLLKRALARTFVKPTLVVMGPDRASLVRDDEIGHAQTQLC